MPTPLRPTLARWRNNPLHSEKRSQDAVHFVIVRNIPVEQPKLRHVPSRPPDLARPRRIGHTLVNRIAIVKGGFESSNQFGLGSLRSRVGSRRLPFNHSA